MSLTCFVAAAPLTGASARFASPPPKHAAAMLLMLSYALRRPPSPPPRCKQALPETKATCTLARTASDGKSGARRWTTT